MSKIQCGELQIELFGLRHSTLQSHGLSALAKHLLVFLLILARALNSAALPVIRFLDIHSG